MAKEKKTSPTGTRKKLKRPANYCFGCGLDNDAGMKLKFAVDATGKRMVARFRMTRRYTGPPGHLHGGIIATILDEAMGKVNKLRQVTAMTREMTIEYLKPTPLNQWLIAEGWEQQVRGRVHFNEAEIRNEAGVVLARGRGTFIAIDAQKMFARQLKTRARHVAFLQPLTSASAKQAKAKAGSA